MNHGSDTPPQAPPRYLRCVMMLIVIPKKVTGEKSRQMVFCLATRLMPVIMFAFMRLVGAEIK
jgi:hypothetical protein